MSDEFDDIVKQDYVKFRNKKVTVIWQKKWVVLRKACSKGPRRLEVFPDEQACVVSSIPKVHDLVGVIDIRRVNSDTKKNAIEVTNVDGSSVAFACDSDLNTKHWLSALQTDDGLDRLTENKADIFNVYLLPSSSLSVFGECLLQVTEDQLCLLHLDSAHTEIAAWPLIALRRFGKDESKFTFECGRKCETGEGMFVLNTKVGSKIHQRVHSATQAIATTYRVMKRQQDENERKDHQPPTPPPSSLPSPSIPASPLGEMFPSDGETVNVFGRAPHPLPRPPPAATGKLDIGRHHSPIPDDNKDYERLVERPDSTSYVVPSGTDSSPDDQHNSRHGANGYQGGASPNPATSIPHGGHANDLSSRSVSQPGDNGLEEIYEEKGLNVKFRKFLAIRKSAPL